MKDLNIDRRLQALGAAIADLRKRVEALEDIAMEENDAFTPDERQLSVRFDCTAAPAGGRREGPMLNTAWSRFGNKESWL